VDSGLASTFSSGREIDQEDYQKEPVTAPCKRSKIFLVRAMFQ
jgi:hypothetical protein